MKFQNLGQNKKNAENKSKIEKIRENIKKRKLNRVAQMRLKT